MVANAYLFVFDGFADWEPALALCEMRQQGGLSVVAVAESLEPVVSRGGLRVLPDATLAGVLTDVDGIFILPGGDMWEGSTPPMVEDLLGVVRERQSLIAAICGATVAVARAGLLDGVRHTSNTRDYLLALAPGHPGHELYLESLAVRHNNVITASGAGYVEFAREIIISLGLYDEAATAAWYDLFKHGLMPEM
jgi:putative intracellular protease/amidase